MAKDIGKKQNKKKKKTKAEKESYNQLMSVVLFTLGLLLTFLAFVKGTAGWLALHSVLLGLFGGGSYFLGPVFCYIAVMSSLDRLTVDTNIRVVLTGITILLISAANQIFAAGATTSKTFFSVIKELYSEGEVLAGGGVFGAIFSVPLMKLGKPGDAIVVLLLLFMMFMILTKSTIAGFIKKARRPVQKIADTYTEITVKKQAETEKRKNSVIDIPLDTAFNEVLPKKSDTLKRAITKAEAIEPAVATDETHDDDGFIDEDNKAHIEEIIRRVQLENSLNIEKPALENQESANFDEAHYFEESAEPVPQSDGDEAFIAQEVAEIINVDAMEAVAAPQVTSVEEYIYEKPSAELLNKPNEEADMGDTAKELRENAQRLVDTLQSFGVQTRIVDISRGPAVTRYELQPSAGVKISKITNLADDIALNLAAAGVRIEAPIPNKAAVGIEIPNKIVTFVTLKEVLTSQAFENSKGDITVALGRDVSGNVKLADIAKMPHLLIAGATGSGKSVCINSIIMSIIFRSDPKDVKLMLVDPKMVELGVYNGIPHLVVPVVNDAKKAAGVLGWAVTEMLSRYKMFAANGVRDIKTFNKFVENKGEDENTDLKKMPHIVIIVDELADLMMAAPRDVEDHICRLAQMARAAGMHLIIATQRPSVDVITGVIKANIPSRIAFAVSSQIDSRTILDMAGAEKLIGQGDMLFYPVGASKPTRVQGCFVSDEEIEKVVDFIKNSQEKESAQYDTVVMEEIEKHVPQEKGSSSQSGNSDEGDDEIINDAIECVVTNGVASTSFLQRKLKLGYARAARVIDELESRGVISSYEGSKPRQVLMTKERLAEMKMMKGD